MSSKFRKLMLVAAVFAALAMLMSMTSISFAGGEEPVDGKTVCVSGYVINHREQPVDGTKLGLKVYVFGRPGTTNVADLPDMSAQFESAEALEAMAAGPDMAGADGEAYIWDVADVDAKGFYEFKKLPAGYYYNFFLPLPQEWDGIVPVAPLSGVASTGWAKFNEQGSKCYTVLFKIRRWFDVTVLKWEELRDGMVQEGVGWTITAYPQGDPWAVKDSDVTNADGYTVLQLTPGKWLIQETVKAGWTPVTPHAVYITLDQYAGPGATDPVVFKNREPVCYATITVEKNGLGTRKLPDGSTQQEWLGPLAGWKITLSRPDGAMYPVTLVTDGTGKAVFKNLKPGVYHVTETVQPGWEPVTENPQQVVIQDCENKTVVVENLEVVGKLQISGTKYFKAWVPPYQGQTVGLSGWAITATLKGTSVSISEKTNALGQYYFSEQELKDAGMAIAGATITVCEEKRDHWIPVGATCVDVHFPYPVPLDYKGAVVNFTNMQDPPLPGGGVGSSGGATASCTTTYVVQKGDNLSSIAAGYGTTVSALVQLNGLANPNLIRAGQTLCIQ